MHVAVADPAPRPAAGLRAELGRLVALIGLAGAAIAHPVLDVFGRSPETFVFHDATGADLVLFGVAVVLVPPMVLWGPGVAVGVVAPRWRVFVHGASIGVLAGLVAVQVFGDLPRPAAVALALAAGGAAWVLTVRSGVFRLWSRFLVALPILALVVFLVASPASELLIDEEFVAAAGNDHASPLVLIVLDELPTASIVDADGAIDAVRFPNLARLAGQSTWYRNHTTQAGFTAEAVPTIFTGRRPRFVPPLYTQHPDNLFRLLAGSHDLVVSEALTRLCPVSVCGTTPQAPGAEDDEDAGEAGPSTGALFDQALDVWGARVGGAAGPVEFSGFEEQADDEPVAPDERFSTGEVAPELDVWTEDATASQPARLTQFLDALQPGERPLAAVLHLVAPHFPWRNLPDGRTYADPAKAADLPINGGGDPWVADLERQRHLLQASYVDRLVGQVLDRLVEVGVYEDAAIAVTADHGIAFRGAENRRWPVPEALPEIMWSPLIVKAPGQATGRVDDANVQSIDVLPTLASLIGVEIPWPVDGLDATSEAISARGDRKEFRRFESTGDPGPSEDIDVDGVAGLATVLDLAFPGIEAGDDAVRGLYERSGRGELVGEPYQPTGELGRSVFAVDDLDRLLASEQPVLVLTGTVAGGEPGAEHVVAAIDGEVVAVSPVVPRAIGGPAFALLLPTTGELDLRDVRLGLARGSDLLDGGPLAG